LLTLEIIRLFNSPETNPNNAQLIFATHDTGLLGQSLLRRDQIWFTEKDRYGATALYSLAELNVRNDASFDKGYIAGRYGAIPFISGLRALFEEIADGENP
jgi:AAA15 family ATPase/GTPase